MCSRVWGSCDGDVGLGALHLKTLNPKLQPEFFNKVIQGPKVSNRNQGA